MQRRNAEADDDAAENAHFKRLYADNVGNRALGQRIVFDFSRYGQQRVYRLMHNEK